MSKYKYKILSYWNNSDDLYVNYIVEDTETKNTVNAIECYTTSDLACDYNSSSVEDIIDSLTELIKENDGLELNLPKVSEASPLLKYIYDFVCESDDDMCHIDYNDWEELKEDEEFIDKDINILKKEIDKYNLYDYIILDNGEYMICGYGGLQCCFNDDGVRERDDIER